MEDKCHLFFGTLASKLKLNIILALREHPKSVNELSKELGEERSKVSHGLKVLRRCKFINANEEGRKRIYYLNKDTMVSLFELVDKHVEKYCKKCEAEV